MPEESIATLCRPGATSTQNGENSALLYGGKPEEHAAEVGAARQVAQHCIPCTNGAPVTRLV